MHVCNDFVSREAKGGLNGGILTVGDVRSEAEFEIEGCRQCRRRLKIASGFGIGRKTSAQVLLAVGEDD